MKKLPSFKRTRASVRIVGIRKVASILKLPVFDVEENDELEKKTIHSVADKTTHLMTAVLRRGVEM